MSSPDPLYVESVKRGVAHVLHRYVRGDQEDGAMPVDGSITLGRLLQSNGGHVRVDNRIVVMNSTSRIEELVTVMLTNTSMRYATTTTLEEMGRAEEEEEVRRWWNYDTYASTILIVAYGLVFVAGLVGNLLVALTVLRGSTSMRRCVTNLFLVNLAIADLLVVIFCIPFTLIARLIYRESPPALHVLSNTHQRD